MSTSGITRTPKEGNFTQLDNALLQNESLSGEATIALAYLLSKPDDWKLWNGDLGRRFKWGRNKVEKVIRELKDAGYLTRPRTRGAHGRWVYSSQIYDKPQQTTVPQSPGTGDRGLVDRTPVSGAYTKTDSPIPENKEKKTNVKLASGGDVVLPSAFDTEATEENADTIEASPSTLSDNQIVSGGAARTGKYAQELKPKAVPTCAVCGEALPGIGFTCRDYHSHRLQGLTAAKGAA